jgi:hypothetical protein
MVTMGILPHQGKNPHGRAGNPTRDLIISSQKRWPLDHEDGHFILSVASSAVPYMSIVTDMREYFRENCADIKFFF